LRKLKAIFTTGSLDCSNAAFGRIFIDFAAHVPEYAQFAAAYHNTQQALSDALRKHPKFAALHAKLKADPRTKGVWVYSPPSYVALF